MYGVFQSSSFLVKNVQIKQKVNSSERTLFKTKLSVENLELQTKIKIYLCGEMSKIQTKHFQKVTKNEFFCTCAIKQ